jgi:hypothetical protein
LALFICVGFAGIYLQFLQSQDKLKRLTKTAPAKIEKVDVIRYVDPVFGKEGTAYLEVSFAYTIDQTAYEGHTKMNGVSGQQFVPWNDAKVCYDPLDPTTIADPELFPSQYSCGR